MFPKGLQNSAWLIKTTGDTRVYIIISRRPIWGQQYCALDTRSGDRREYYLQPQYFGKELSRRTSTWMLIGELWPDSGRVASPGIAKSPNGASMSESSSA